VKWDLVVFAAGTLYWRQAAQRLRRQAIASGLFDEVRVADAHWLRNEHPEIWHAARTSSTGIGFGHFRWKPHLIDSALSEAATWGKGVVYLDAGCELNVNTYSVRRFREYLQMSVENGFVAMALELSQGVWTKQETLQFFGMSQDGALKTAQVSASALFFPPTRTSLELVSEWSRSADIMSGFLFDNELDESRQHPKFQAHRFDQSVLTCLVELQGMTTIPDESYFHDEWQTRGSNYPVWVLRNKFPFSRKPGSFGDSAVRSMVKVRNAVQVSRVVSGRRSHG